MKNSPRTHYNNALSPEKASIPACEPNKAHLATTTDRRLVTCGRCRVIIGVKRES